MAGLMHRLAVLSMHTSPLAQPGTGDGGGMNVYVRELAAALARAGVQCDVYTRAFDESLRAIVPVEPGLRVHHVAAGPLAPVAKEDLPEGVHMEVPVPLATDELPPIVERFANVARRLERCGLDGAEVTSFGGHLIEQFFDPRVNTRTDAYGGSLENRTRFAREVLEAVRATVSDTFIVGFRMAVDQCLTGGLGPDDMIEIARSVASTGAVDLFSVSGGTGEQDARCAAAAVAILG